MRWKHRPAFVHRKGKVKVQCCGEQSDWLASDAEARQWHQAHTGLIERRKHDGNAPVE